MTIDIPLPDFLVRYGHEALGVCGRDNNVVDPCLLLYDLETLLCLNTPQTNFIVLRP